MPCVRREVGPGGAALRRWRVHFWQGSFPGGRVPGLRIAAKATGGGRVMPGLQRLKEAGTR